MAFGHDAPGKPDAAVLGQLMTAESLIQVLPDERRIAEFSIPAIRNVPGVSDVGICIEGTGYNMHWDLRDRCDQCDLGGGNTDRENNRDAGNGGGQIFAVSLKTASMLLGCLVFQLDDPAAYAVYEPFIRNYINFLAICLENQRQKEILLNNNHELQRHRDDLEELVRFRNKELAKSEERFSLVMNASRDGLWDWNLDTDEVYYSPRWQTMLGYEPQELPPVSETWRSLMHPDDAVRTEEKVMAHMQSGTPFEAEFRMRTRAGGWKWILGRGKAVAWDKNGQATRMVGTHSDITERKHIGEALKSSEKRLLRAQSVASVGSWELDLHTKKMWASEEAHRIYGLEMTPDQELPLSKAQSVVLPAYRPEMDKALADFISSGEKYDQYYEIMRQNDSAVRHIHSMAELECDREGRPFKVVGTIQDVTDAKKRERDLRSSEERNRLILHTAMDGFWRLDGTGRLLEVNEAYCRMSGYEMHELLAMTVADVEASESPRDVVSHMQVLAEKGLDRFESRHRRKNGSLFDVEVSVQFIQGDNQGEFVAFVRDITERNLSEKRLRKSETLFREIFNNMSNGVAIYEAVDNGQDFVFKGLNQAGLEATGKKLEDVAGRRVREVFPGVEKLGLFDIFRRVWKTGRPEQHPSSFYQDEKVILWVENYVCKLPSGEILAVYEDTTARKQAEEESHRLESQLRHAQKMEAIGTLAGGIAHDFNNILGAVLGYAEIAHEDSVKGQSDPDDINEIINAAERAKELVEQILTFSRKNEPNLRPLNVNQACMKARNLLHRTIPKMISVESDFTQKLPYISADSTQMEQVLLNLCSNAADAMPDGGCLTLTTRLVRIKEKFHRLYPEVPPGDYVLLTVSDTGCGMDRETCEHIFEPFFTTKEIGKGTGLGLSTAYGIIKSHGGFIYCESDPGQGTTFSIYLPVMAQKPTDSLPEPKAEGGTTHNGTETVLLVDDEKALRAITKRMLRGSGYRVLEASSGEEALKVYAEQPTPPDLVITDLGMPGMGGNKAMLEILARYPGAKFIVVSGYAAHAEIGTALASGAKDYIAKPFKKVELLNKARNVLDNK